MKTDRRIVVALFAAALGLRVALLLMRPFDGLYGQDAFAYYDYALTLRAAVLQGQAIPAFFWPIGYPLLSVAAMSVLGASPLAAQIVSVIAGALVAPLTYALTREVLIERDPKHARSAAMMAGLIVAVGGQLLISGVSIMSDAAALMWATASAWSVLRYTRGLKLRWFGLAVLTLSLAVITRWAMALLAVPWTLAVLWTWRERWAQIRWRRAALSIGLAALIGGVIVGGQFWSGSHTGDLNVVGWNPISALQRDVINSDGVFHYALPMAVYYAQPMAHPAYTFPLCLPLLLIGLWSVWQLHAARRVIVIGWLLILYVFLIGITWQNPRFMVTFVPPLAVGVGAGYAALAGRVGRSSWRRALYMYVSLALIGMLLWSYRVATDFIDKKQIDLAHVAQVQAQVAPDATLLTFGLTATARHYTGLRVIELFSMDEAALGREVQSGERLYLLIDPDNIEQQWQTKSPAINYHWLQAHTRLEPVATLTPYQLFEVIGPAS